MDQPDHSPTPPFPPGVSPEPGAVIEALQESSRQLLTFKDFKETAAVIYRVLKKLLGAAAGYVALLSRNGQDNDLLFLDAGGLPCAVDPSLPMPVRGLRAEAYRTGRVIYENDFPASPWAEFLPPEHARLENVLFAPLIIQEKTVGVIGLANKPGGFSEADAQAAGLFGELAAVALLNSRNLELLQTREEQFQAVAQTATDAIVSADGDGLVTFWNKQASALFGYPEEEIIGRPVTAIIPEGLQERHCAAMRRVRVIGLFHLAGRTLETTGRHRDGREIPIELSLSAWEFGRKVNFTAIIRDITGRKQSEKALEQTRMALEQQVQARTADLQEANTRLEQEMTARRSALEALEQSERKFRAIFNQTFQLIGLLEPDGTVLEINQSTLDFLSLDYAATIGKSLLSLKPGTVPPPLREKVKEGITEAARGNFVRFELPVDIPPRDRQWIDFSIKPVFNDRRKEELLIVEARDISALKKSELALLESKNRLQLLSAQVLQAQETERKRIAKELHDGIGQYLGAIKYRVEHALVGKGRTKVPQTGFLQDMIPVIQEAIEEIRRICMDLRPSILDDLGIRATLSWFCREFQKTYSHLHIEPEISAEEEQIPGPLKIIIFRITQEALNNIAKHSAAGSIRLVLARDDQYLRLEIRDDGRGFALEQVGKGAPAGRGLGLESMRERAELSGGAFQIVSAMGEGTLIRATWPLINADAGCRKKS